MEQVLDIYQRPYDADYPVVCLDETSKQLVEHVRAPIPAKPGQIAREDDEYKRNGVAAIFMAVEPLTGKCVTDVPPHRGCLEFAWFVLHLCDVVYPNAKRICLVMDNLNTHSIASLYATFSPEQAHRIASRLDMHYTPKHGSWLNMAEIELSVLARQCLDQRIATLSELANEVRTWTHSRNADPCPIRWQFTTADARIKLRRLYPSRGV
jgi:hypothetical protein